MGDLTQIVIEDTHREETLMDKKVHYAAKFAMDLRLEIWKELFGFEVNEMIDPCDDGFWKELKERAKVFIGVKMDMDFFFLLEQH